MIKFPLFSATGIGIPAELMEPPQFLKELKERGDILALLYWINALGALKAAALSRSTIQLGMIFEKLKRDGHKSEMEELLAHIDRVREAYESRGMIELEILLVDHPGGE